MEFFTVLLAGLGDILGALSGLLTPLDRFNHWLLGQVQELFERFGYLVVFLGTCLENLLFLGLFVPGVVILMLAGLAAAEGTIDVRLVILVGVIGTSLGDTGSYLAGRFGWQKALRRAEQMPLMGTVRSTFMRRTGLFVLSYHFLGYTRLLGPLTAGALRLPFRRWWLLDLTGATLWATTYVLVGYVFGRLGFSFEAAKEHVETLDRVLLGLGIVAVIGYLILRPRLQRDDPPAPDPVAGEETSEPTRAS
jgi:membrane protein DedA with SNARE-associated domain